MGPLVEGTFAWAMFAIANDEAVTRTKRDEHGGRAWRRHICFFGNVVECWPSGFVSLYTPSQEDMQATDWEIV